MHGARWIASLVVAAVLAVSGALGSALAAQEASPVASPVASEAIVVFDAESGEFPEGVAVADDGTIYVSLAFLGQLVRIDPEAGEVEPIGSIAGLQEGDFGLLGVEIGPDGSVYGGVSSSNPEANGVWRFDVATGEATRVEGTEAIGLPNDVAFDDAGNMYASDTAGGAVWIVPVDGTATAWLQDPLLTGNESAGMGSPLGANGITVAEGTVYVGVTERGTVVTIPIEEDGSAGAPAVLVDFSSEETVPLVDGVEIDAEGNVYATHLNMNEVVRVLADGTVETIATVEDGLDGPASVAIRTNPDGTESAIITNLSFALNPIVPPGGVGPSVVAVTLDSEM